MINLILAITALGPLGPRPETLTGPDGHATYEAHVREVLNSDTITVRMEAYFGTCPNIQFISEGYDLVVDDSLQTKRQFAVPYQFPEHLKLAIPARTPDGTLAIEHFQATGCGKTYRVNIAAGQTPQTKALFGAFNISGYSLANPDIQRQVEGAVWNLTQANRQMTPHPTCNRLGLVYDVRIVAPPKAANSP